MTKQKGILLLEDNEIESVKVERALNKLGFNNKVSICRNGVEGLQWLDENKDDLPGLILLDLKMPIMDGIEFLKRIKEHELFTLIPVVILTTSTHSIDKLEGFKNHAAGYMVKPVRYSDFVTMLETIKHYWETSETAY